jgi:S-DNA-T family DNA segregation ATPase FtsK/SpoIIIE
VRKKTNPKTINPENEVESMALAPQRSRSKPILAMVFLLLSIVCGAALYFYDADQSNTAQGDKGPDGISRTLLENRSSNPVGIAGDYLAKHTFEHVGMFTWTLPLFLLLTAWALLFHRKHIFTMGRLIAFCLFLMASCGLATFLGRHLFYNDKIPPSSNISLRADVSTHPSPSHSTTTQDDWSKQTYINNQYPGGLGGTLGELVYNQAIHNLLGAFGSAIVLFFIWGISGLFLFIYRFPFVLGQAIEQYAENRKLAKEARLRRREEMANQGEFSLPSTPPKSSKITSEVFANPIPPQQKSGLLFWKKLNVKKSTVAPAMKDGVDPVSLEEAALANATEELSRKLAGLSSETASASTPRIPTPRPSARKEPQSLSESLPSAPAEARNQSTSPLPKIIQSEKVEKARIQLPKRKGDYIFPTLDLLENHQTDASANQEDYHAVGEALTQTLETFGVKVTLKDIHVGPVITRYDVLPAPGTRVSNIQNLENDIAMGMKALAVRILAPVPGTNVVGIEVPNRVPQPVCLREILESKAWAESKAEIPIGLGKDVSGNPLVADLTKMPHLLIAGSTGSGKTVCINSIIASLLYHSSPEDLRFIMIDPKVVEMQVYNSLPHMLIPVVTDPKKVPHALKWLINEMTRRYNVFAKVKVRNIAGYNAYQKKNYGKPPEPSKPNDQGEFEIPRELDDPEELPEKFPYIVCIIDELADLMMVAPADVEQGIARLAQLARAAGIHLILATQRPSVKVITGTIKANLPSRIAFKVAALVDSRTILDAKGAEQLIGRGDMLFLPPGQARLVRSQGAFVSDDEINGIVEYLKQNGEPQYEEAVQNEIDRGGEGGSGDDGDQDPLYEDALDVLRTTRRASTSMLQRKLKIGYNRAARIMEILEDRGIVGPENGASPREILVDPDTL